MSQFGADDYICEPFSPREAMARVRAVLRRHRHDPNAMPTHGLVVDDSACRASVAGRDLDLTQVEFQLGTLCASPSRVYSREQLMDRVYVDHRIVTNRTVDSHIKNLRCKLPDVGGEEWVRSVYGVGYRFEYLSEALPKTQQLHVNNAQRSHLQPPRRAGQRCLPWAYQREHEKPALASNAPSTIERMRPRRFTAATPQRPVSG